MVVCFVLEHEQPVLFLSVHIDLYLDRAGIDLIADFQIFQLAALAQRLSADRGDIHQGHHLASAMYFFPQADVCIIGLLDRFLQRTGLDLHILQDRFKGRMPAVIRPVCIEHLQFGHRQIALFLITEIRLHMDQVRQRHRQAFLLPQCLQGIRIKTDEALDDRYWFDGHIFLVGQDAKILLTHLHRVDQILTDRSQLLFADRAIHHDDVSALDDDVALVVEQHQTLLGAVGPLIILPRQTLIGDIRLIAQIDRIIDLIGHDL